MIHYSFRVLLVEDVTLLARITQQMLKKSFACKYTVVHKTTLAEAIGELNIDEFDVVLLDLNLPDSAEIATLQKVLETAPDIPVIVLTSNQRREIGFETVKSGAQDFLIKGEINFIALDRAIVFAIERHRLQRTVRQLAVIDELTSLYNRRGFNTLHPDILDQVRDSDKRGYLCYFDLDRFKQINDEFGHKKGDEALVEFASNLRSVFRKNALLVRLGGDEFVAMGVEDEPGQVQMARQSLDIVLSVRNRPGASEFTLECSCGIALFDRSGPLTIEELSGRADAALYRDKEGRRRDYSRSHETAEAVK